MAAKRPPTRRIWGVDRELRLGPAATRRVFRGAFFDFLRSSRSVLAFVFVLGVLYVILVLGTVGFLAVLKESATTRSPGQTLWLVIGFKVMQYGVSVALLFWAMDRIYKRHVRRSLARAGYEVCLHCGYWLRGLDASIARCPECGSQREPPAARG